jgi:molybdate transport system permease protein
VLTPEEGQVIVLSLKVALWSVAVSLPFAVAVSWLLARKDFFGKSLFDAVVHLPLVLPPVVVGYMLLLALGRRGPLGALLYDWFGITVVFTWMGAAIACAVMGFPLMVRAIRLSMEAIDPKLEQAAQTLGAGALGRFWTVMLPLALPGVLTGMLLSFARSLGEFGATITFVSNIPGETRTLPLAIYTLTQVPGGDEQALRLCAIAVVLSIAALLVSETLVRRASRKVLGYDAVGRH